jgi:hypothetical protein
MRASIVFCLIARHTDVTRTETFGSFSNLARRTAVSCQLSAVSVTPQAGARGQTDRHIPTHLPFIRDWLGFPGIVGACGGWLCTVRTKLNRTKEKDWDKRTEIGNRRIKGNSYWIEWGEQRETTANLISETLWYSLLLISFHVRRSLSRNMTKIYPRLCNPLWSTRQSPKLITAPPPQWEGEGLFW